MLLYIQCVVNPDTGEATDDLQPQVVKMLQQLGSNCTTVSQVIESEDKAVFKAIQDGIDRYNTHHTISNAQKVIATGDCRSLRQSGASYYCSAGTEMDITGY